MQDRSRQVSRKYRLVHRGLQEDIVRGDRNQDLDREKCQGKKLALLVHEQVHFWYYLDIPW